MPWAQNPSTETRQNRNKRNKPKLDLKKPYSSLFHILLCLSLSSFPFIFICQNSVLLSVLCPNTVCLVKIFIIELNLNFFFFGICSTCIFLQYLYWKLLVIFPINITRTVSNSYLKCLPEWLGLSEHSVALSNTLKYSVHIFKIEK